MLMVASASSIISGAFLRNHAKLVEGKFVAYSPLILPQSSPFPVCSGWASTPDVFEGCCAGHKCVQVTSRIGPLPREVPRQSFLLSCISLLHYFNAGASFRTDVSTHTPSKSSATEILRRFIATVLKSICLKRPWR